MKLETKQKLNFVAMLFYIILGFFLMIVQITGFSLREVIASKLAGFFLLYIGFNKAKSIFRL